VTAMTGHVHLIGIGGMHMSAIAQILLSQGTRVSGSDLAPSAITDRLRSLGATVYAGHEPENIGDATLVVATAAAKSDNVEVMEAKRRGIALIPRHEMVARLMKGRTAIAVAGTHGKTTTSSLIAVILKAAGLEPGYLLGGESVDLGGNAAPGGGERIVVEADEYAGAFLAYHPTIAAVTNVEVDHLDYFGSADRIKDAFEQFLQQVEDGGLIVACADSPVLREIVDKAGSGIRARVEWYGFAEAADWRISAISLGAHKSTFEVKSPLGDRGPFALKIPGRHNVSNALAAIAAVGRLGVDDETIGAALSNFRGVHRRFEIAGDAGGITVVDDYAHHPTEIEATLAAARSRYPDRTLVVLFQPHTYSRTSYLLDRFRCCFKNADRLYLLQTFAARETGDAGLDAYGLAGALTTAPAAVLETQEDAVARLARDLKPNDVCFTMGAGDVTNVGGPLLEELRRR
jgi:UDP-N-acetylmuramate--alanine ligase